MTVDSGCRMVWSSQRGKRNGTTPTSPRVFDRVRGWTFGTPWKPTSRRGPRRARVSGTPSTDEVRERNERISSPINASTVDMPMRLTRRTKGGIAIGGEVGGIRMFTVVEDVRLAPVGGKGDEVDDRRSRIWTRNSTCSGRVNLPSHEGKEGNSVGARGTISMERDEEGGPSRKIWMQVRTFDGYTYG